MSKTIAVLMPAYRATKYINEAVKSVLRQQLQNGWAVDLRIGVDGCEETSDYLRLPHYYSNENVGPFVIINSLIAQGPADVYATFDADDVMYDDYFQACFAQKADVVVPRRREVDKNLRPIKSSGKPGHGSLVFKDKVLSALGGYAHYRAHSDIDFVRRAELAGFRVKYTKRYLKAYRRHSGQVTADAYEDSVYELRREWKHVLSQQRDDGIFYIKPVTVDLIKVAS